MKKLLSILIILFSISTLFSCGGKDYIPKEKGYMRIDLPEHEYLLFDTLFPYSFEKSIYSPIVIKEISDSNIWFNLVYPRYNARIHFMSSILNDNLEEHIIKAHKSIERHYQKATSVPNKEWINDEYNVYGLIFEIKGSEVASPLQFYLTDSTNNYIHGSLYFYNTPNNDSLHQVIEYINEDVQHLIETFKWKEKK